MKYDKLDMNLILNSFRWRRYPAVIRVINFVTECHTVSHHGAFCFSMIHHTYKVSYIFDKRKNRDVKIDFFASKISRKMPRKSTFQSNSTKFISRTSRTFFVKFKLWSILVCDACVKEVNFDPLFIISARVRPSSPKYCILNTQWIKINDPSFSCDNFVFEIISGSIRGTSRSLESFETRFDPKSGFFQNSKSTSFFRLDFLDG